MMNQLTFPLQRNNSVRNVDPINSKSKIRIEPMIVVFNSPVRFSIIIVRYYLYYKIHFMLIYMGFWGFGDRATDPYQDFSDSQRDKAVFAIS